MIQRQDATRQATRQLSRSRPKQSPDTLSHTDREFLSAAAERINCRLKNTLADMVVIGRELLVVKERLPHGQFGEWIATEFGWSHRTAQGFIRVAGAFSKAQNLRICPSAAVRLAAGATPEAAFAEAIERAEAGEEITHRAAAEIIARHKGDTEPAESEPPAMAERLERIDALAFSVPELTAWINEGLAAGFPDSWKQPPVAMVQSALKRETDPANVAALVKASHAAQNFHAEQHLRLGRELGSLITAAAATANEAAEPEPLKCLQAFKLIRAAVVRIGDRLQPDQAPAIPEFLRTLADQIDDGRQEIAGVCLTTRDGGQQ